MTTAVIHNQRPGGKVGGWEKANIVICHLPHRSMHKWHSIFLKGKKKRKRGEKASPLYSFVRCTSGPLILFVVESAEKHLNLFVIHLDLSQGLFDVLQRGALVGFVGGTGFILAGAVVLDLLAGFLDLAQTQRCRRSFEEVTERRQIRKFLLLPTDVSAIFSPRRRKTYRAFSIFSNVLSACSKNPYTIPLLKSRSSSSSISRICSKVDSSIESAMSESLGGPVLVWGYQHRICELNRRSTYRLLCRLGGSGGSHGVWCVCEVSGIW